MRRAKLGYLALAAAGLLALSSTNAQAGGGAGGGGTGFEGFQCYSIVGTNQDRVVNLTDQFGSRQNVDVGRGLLICTPVAGEVVVGNELDVLPVDEGGNSLADHFKCYDVPPFARDGRRVRLIDVNAEVRITDQFDVEVLKAHTPILLCMHAVKVKTTP